jgi:hypothetical protein
MPRSKTDPYKRKCAQALNHLAAAILDINDVYVAFGDQVLKLNAQEGNPDAVGVPEQLKRYKNFVQTLELAMMGTAAIREEIVKFIGEAWMLDEESIKVYMG